MLKLSLSISIIVFATSVYCQSIFEFKSETIDISKCKDVAKFTTTVLDSSFFFKQNSSVISHTIKDENTFENCEYYPLSLTIIGFENFISNEILKSRKTLLKADSIYSLRPNKLVKYSIRNKIFLGINYRAKADTTKAMSYFRKAIDLSKASRNIYLQSDAMNNMGFLLYGQNDFPKALQYCTDALKLAEESGNLEIQAFGNMNLSRIFNAIGNYSKALEYISRSEELFFELNESRNIYPVLVSTGEIQHRNGDKNEAIKSLLKAEKLGNQSNHFFEHGIIYKLLGDIYFESEDYDESSEYYEKALSYQNTLNESQYSKIVKRQTDYYSQKGQLIKLQKLIKEIVDINSQNRKELTIEFLETQKIENQIQEEKFENNLLQVENANSKRRFKILTFASLICILFGFFALKESFKNKRLNTKINNQNEELKNRNIELKNFTSIASHDLKAPIRSISGFIGLIEKKLHKEPTSDVSNYLNIIKRSANNMHSLVSNLLEFSTLESQKLTVEEFSLDILLNDVLLDLSELINAQNAKVEIASNLPKFIKGDKVLLRVVFQNLLNNALKFVKSGVTPIIKVEYDEDNSNHYFKIIDNGIGIDEKYLEKVFLMFERLNSSSKFEGSGIGLATCKKIILLHRGDISISSEINIGSTFKITLPKGI